ncbi:MAG TPA: Ig-like domain-containing protein [Chloroflexia bacterium]
MDTSTEGSGPGPRDNRRLLMGAGIALALLLLVGVGVWRVLSQSPTDAPRQNPNATSTPGAIAGGGSGLDGWVTVYTPGPARTPDSVTPGAAVSPTTPPADPTVVGNAQVESTPTLIAGAATFTPVTGQGQNGSAARPRVLGITAGVGMRSGDIAGAAPLAVTFSEAMDQASAQSAFLLSPHVPGKFAWTTNTLLFTPDQALQPSTSYTVTVAADARSQQGESVASPLSASFQTAPPPAVLRTLPSAGASEVPTDTIVTITFNRPMIPLTALDSQPDPSQWVTISPQVQGRWVWLGTAAVGFHPASGFLPSTAYTVDVKAGWPDAAGVTLGQGAGVSFTTVRPAILSVSPSNGSERVDLDTPIILHFNMPMDHASVESNIGLPVPSTAEWSPDSTVVTFTSRSLLEFSRSYTVQATGSLKPARGNAAELTGGASANRWSFRTTSATHVENHYPENSYGPAAPGEAFGFYFNNPLAPDQDVARFLTIDPTPVGYIGQLTAEGTGVYTSGVQLLPDTTYKFSLKDGLKDKWGFPVAGSTWEVQIGPLPPGVLVKGGLFQPVYSEGPTRARIEASNLDKFKLQLYTLSDDDVRQILTLGIYDYRESTLKVPGQLRREWDVDVPQAPEGQAATLYPVVALDANADRLPPGFYLLRASAPSPYSDRPLESAGVLVVGRTGVVTKSEGNNLFIWAADLGSGKPVPGYNLRLEQFGYEGSRRGTQRGTTGADGVLRLVLDDASQSAFVSVWSDGQGDTLLATTGWSRNLYFSYYGGESALGERGAIYTDRPIYRPAQTVYFRGVVRADDDALYSLPDSGIPAEIQAYTYGNNGQTNVYTGTVTLSQMGTFSGQFLLPADAPTGSYTVAMSRDGAASDPYSYGYSVSASFQVEEYRKPDFQVSVTATPEVVHGDPLVADITSSYYFGGPLSNVTATVNLLSDLHYFSWSDPDTGESYQFGTENPIIYYSYPPRPDSEPVVTSLQVRTNKDGLATVDVSRYVTTTEGSRSVLIEGQVQDLSNQAVANSTTAVVHQGQFYVGLRTSDYVAQAKQPLTVTVRTVQSLSRNVQPNSNVSLRFVRVEWKEPPGGRYDLPWAEVEVPAGDANVTTDANGRATYLFTPPQGGSYRIYAESRDARGNAIKSSMGFYAYSDDPGYVPWRYENEQQVELVADKEQYKAGDVARILVTSPFTEATALLTVERGHLRRYRLVTLQGGAPTIEVALEEGDLPNVYIGLTLLGQERPPVGAPADWANKVTMRQGYVGLTLDTSGKQLEVSIEPQGQGPFEPGTTASVKVSTRDSSGKGVPGELSLAVVDEAIYAMSEDNATRLFDAFWSQRGLSVRTGTSFTSDESRLTNAYAEGDMAGMPATGPAEGQEAKRAPVQPLTGGGGDPAPAKVRVDFRDTAFWTSAVTTGADGSAVVSVPLPDNLTTWRLTAQGINLATQAGTASAPMTVTQPLLIRSVLPRFFLTGDNPHPQAIVHNNTGQALDVQVSLVVSGAIALDAATPAVQRMTLQPDTQTVVNWTASVGKGDIANLRYWVHTVGNAGEASYREDAIGLSLPVKPFAAPEAVATSGEVSGTRAEETIFLPFTVNPLLGELEVQVSPSLAAATTHSLAFVEEYPYESTDMTVSRFLPLVVLEKVYNEQGMKTPYSAQIPSILQSSLKRLQELQQPDGGWSWWEDGPSSWWQTGYVVQGLVEARAAGHGVPDFMLQRGLERLQQFQQENAPQGVDDTYNLNMRAYSLYVLSRAQLRTPEMRQEGTDLVGQAPRISNHARAWLAMSLGEMGMTAESKTVLDSLAAAARQSSTTAHWEEERPDYWSMATNTRATALAVDALVTLSPNDPLTPKAVRWLMTAQKEGHWLSSMETSISIISLAHYMRASQELTADYTWQVTAFDQLLGNAVANSSNVTQTVTMNLPVSSMPQNTLGTLGLARSSDRGKMYYQVSLRYYVPGEGIKSRSEGLAITRTYYKEDSDDPVKEVNAGDLVRVRLTIVAPETSYYVMVNDPLPAGLEGVNGSLNTTSFTERPPNPMGTIQSEESGSEDDFGFDYGYYSRWWRWGPFDNVEMRDDRTVLFAGYMGPGTYVYEYYARATTPGVYMSLPAHAELLYYPDVFGHSDGGQFTVK